jgi:cytochrome c2
MSSRRWCTGPFVALAVALVACGGANGADPASSAASLAALRGGSVRRGKVAMLRYGCDACHEIAGLPKPTVLVAPPVTGVTNQRYIAGMLPTTPDNLMRWIRDPHSVKPNTAMPDLGVSASDARDMVTYLYSLR